MFLENIEIKNFKSIRHQKIEGCKRINLFIGAPNVGKSNILEALSFLSLLQDVNPTIEQLCRIKEFSELFFDGNIQRNIEIEYLKSRVLEIKYINNNEVKVEIIDYSENNEKGYVYKTAVLKRGERVKVLEDNFELFITTNRDYFVKKFEYVKYIEKNNSNSGELISPYGENLYSIIERNGNLRKDVVGLFSGYRLKLFFDKGDRYNMKVMKTLSDDTVFTIPFHQVADTLQRLIFYKAAIKTNSETILIFEEPESHMFPPYIKLFTDDVIENSSNQYFLNTHSPFVMNEFLESSIDDVAIFAVGYKNGETFIKKLEDAEVREIYDNGIDLFFNIESYI